VLEGINDFAMWELILTVSYLAIFFVSILSSEPYDLLFTLQAVPTVDFVEETQFL
jgi:hypothetical protein